MIDLAVNALMLLLFVASVLGCIVLVQVAALLMAFVSALAAAVRQSAETHEK